MLLGLLSGAPCPLPAATLEDFGYRHLATANHVGTTRPLLIILAHFDTGTPSQGDQDWWNNYVFQTDRPNGSVAGYFQEVSLGRFAWSRVGTVMVTLPASDTEAGFYARFGTNSTAERLHHSNIVYQAMVSADFDRAAFGACDANGDNLVTTAELALLVIQNDVAGSVRPTGRVQPPGFTKAWDGNVVNLHQWGELMTACHELLHQLGALDLYGGGACLNGHLTTMSCTVELRLGDPATYLNMWRYHADPWHKLQLGWAEPRIRSLRAGGLETLWATQQKAATTPLLLHDPVRGPAEFFLLEYRTRTSPADAGYDQDVAGDGLVIWQVRQDANHNPVVEGDRYLMMARGAPDFYRGGSIVWPGGSVTPLLPWYDHTLTRTRIRVHPFQPGAASILVEWLTDEEIWVDFNYAGSPEEGTFARPYNTLAEGLDAVARGGVLKFKPGHTLETAHIIKPMRLEAYGEPVTLGD